MPKKLEPSAFVGSTGGAAAAAQPAKASSLKKPSRSRKAAPKADAAVALSSEAQVESTTRTAKPKTPRAKSTAVTHRHKKSEIAPVAELETLRVEISPAPLVIAAAPVAVSPSTVPEPIQVLGPSAAVKPSAVLEPTNDEIAQLAYSYYVARGYQPGNPAEDWFRAVTELRAKLSA